MRIYRKDRLHGSVDYTAQKLELRRVMLIVTSDWSFGRRRVRLDLSILIISPHSLVTTPDDDIEPDVPAATSYPTRLSFAYPKSTYSRLRVSDDLASTGLKNASIEHISTWSVSVLVNNWIQVATGAMASSE